MMKINDPNGCHDMVGAGSADTALDRPDDAPALGHALQQVSAWASS
jgi:hypothetical protein